MKSKFFKKLMAILVVILLYAALPFLWIRKAFIRMLLRFRDKLQIGTLRLAIHEADEDKEKTDRKNMVVFNTTSGRYEAIQKKVLKNATRVGKNKSNKAMTAGRKKMMKKKADRIMRSERVKQIEKKSLYVTE
jgi:hypothetical protein